MFESDTAAAQEESVIDSVLNDTLEYDPQKMDSLYAISYEDTVATEKPDTVFLLEDLWPGDSLSYESVLQALENRETLISDTLFRDFVSMQTNGFPLRSHLKKSTTL
ncbi:MAG: hypothetical protein U5N56_07365 [Candidatus Marinimicrobia bacterium]|nr:hypothetical protein [Candidatus Neomarinimicrobiota bacterium]